MIHYPRGATPRVRPARAGFAYVRNVNYTQLRNPRDKIRAPEKYPSKRLHLGYRKIGTLHFYGNTIFFFVCHPSLPIPATIRKPYFVHRPIISILVPKPREDFNGKQKA
jgi:hypothetical protein